MFMLGDPVPKIVDHDARREEIASALWRIVDREGIGGVSVRTVAAEAGFPRATAAYYFDNQADLLLMAIRQSVERSASRIRREDFAAEGLDAYVRAVVELIPTTAKRRRQSSIWLEVISCAVRDDTVRSHLADWESVVHAGVLELLTMMKAQHLVSGSRDLDAEADILHAMIDGMSLHVMTDPRTIPATRVRLLVRSHLERLAT